MIYRGALAVKSKPCATADSATQQQDLLRNSRYCYGTTDTATLVRNISRQFEPRIEQSMQRRNVGFVVYVDLFCDIDGHCMLVAAALAMCVGLVLTPQDTKCLHVPTHAIQQ